MTDSFSPVAMFHTITVASHEQVATCFPSGENFTSNKGSRCPLYVLMSSPVAQSHKLAVPAPSPVSRYFPSALMSKQITAFSCLLSTCLGCPEANSQNITFVPDLPVTICLLSGVSNNGFLQRM